MVSACLHRAKSLLLYSTLTSEKRGLRTVELLGMVSLFGIIFTAKNMESPEGMHG